MQYKTMLPNDGLGSTIVDDGFLTYYDDMEVA